MFGSGRRSRTCSESSEGEQTGGRPQSPSFFGAPGNSSNLVAYDLEGKFTYSQVLKSNFGNKMKTTVDENGKFSYISADTNPVPPGWYNIDRSKHKVPIGWYGGDANKK